jgi:hypothetical protein
MAAREEPPSPAVGGFWTRALAANARIVTTPHGFHLFTLAVIATLFVLRTFLFPGIGGDDGEQLVFAQFLAGGYQLRNPPLYTWLVIAAQWVLGPSVAATLAVKFALLWLIYALLWQVTRTMLNDLRLAALAALSPLALYYVAWDAIHGYSHSILVTVAYLFTVWAVLRLDRENTIGAYALLGLAVGLGFLAKYAYGIFMGAMLIACAFDSGLRRRLLHPRLLTTLAVAILVMLPHLLWVVEQPYPLFPPAPEGTRSYLTRVAAGLGHAGIAFVGFLSPLWILWLLFFPRALAPRAVAPAFDPVRRWQRFLGVLFLALAALTAAVIIGLGTDQVRTHYMFVFTLFPLYFFARVHAVGTVDKGVFRFAAAITAFAVVAVVGVIVKFVAEPLRCQGCQHHLPYADFARVLRAAGFSQGTIVAYWHPHPLAGNFRAQFPGARVIDAKHPTVRPPPRSKTGQCLLVWTPKPRPDGSDANGAATIDMANAHLATRLAPDTPAGMIEAPLAMGRGRLARLGYILVPGRGECR